MTRRNPVSFTEQNIATGYYYNAFSIKDKHIRGHLLITNDANWIRFYENSAAPDSYMLENLFFRIPLDPF